MSYTIQEIFTKVESHLLTQNQRSENELGCRYRSEGLMCAVGCLLSDDVYTTDIEGMCAHSLPVSVLKTIIKDDEMETGINLLGELQDLHDIYTVNTWRTKLNTIADDFNLKTSVSVS